MWETDTKLTEDKYDHLCKFFSMTYPWKLELLVLSEPVRAERELCEVLSSKICKSIRKLNNISKEILPKKFGPNLLFLVNSSTYYFGPTIIVPITVVM